LKRPFAIVLATGAAIFAASAIQRFCADEGRFISPSPAKIEQAAAEEAERNWRIQREAESALQSLGARFEAGKSSLPFIFIDHSGKYGTHSSDEHLAKLARVSQTTEAANYLQAIYLNRSPVSDDGLAHLEAYHELAVISLTATQVAGPGLKALAGHGKLAALSLRGTPIDDEGLANLPRLRSLWVLDIEDTAITDEGVLHLANAAPNLRCLFIRGSQVTRRGFDRLREAIPSLGPPTFANRRAEFD
jgi:hypothetical protein